MACVYSSVQITTASFFLAIGFYFKVCTQHFHTLFTDAIQIIDKNASITWKQKLKLKNTLVEAVCFHEKLKR